ncbi:urea amidolyase associated protein UAAP1 [Paenibacillus pinihumi]|uniref:urea amidolyase associated protein UAAP1 n=1 Tax=Paenibacillus pinihumi TaxID=669462 RepID=UPI0004231EFC|nr:urea amidolyase associated protein UAAP1 [Paenibacillus pinihumi]
MATVFTIQAGGKWSGIIGRGKLIDMKALGSRANLSALLYHAPYFSERYNMPDTLKAQHTAYLTQGHILMSDQGKAMVSITADSVGWHDPLSGYTTRSGTDAKYGLTRYQTERNGWYRSGAENLTAEMYRHQLTPRDLTAPVNFFSKVVCEPDGSMRYVSQETKGRTVTLRTEMDVLIVLSNTPNPLDPDTGYPDSAIEIEVRDAPSLLEDDSCLNHCGENRRAFENTWNAYELMRGANRS